MRKGINDLSNDAKSVAYSLMPNMGSRATFHMEISGPSSRSQAALDELVSTGFATKEVHDAKTGACTYRPLVDFSELGQWQFERLMNGELERDSFNLWEKLPEQKP